MGPHSGYEHELLLSGKKPIGLIPSAPRDYEGGGPYRAHSDDIVMRLDSAVAQGRLLKLSLPFHTPDSKTLIANFYGQLDAENDLKNLVDWHNKSWKNQNPPTLTKDIGEYFGYTKADIRLWQEGGYGEHPLVVRKLLEITEPARRYMRVKSM
jgi:hypothetical protein